MYIEDYDDKPPHQVDASFLDRISLKRVDRDIFTGWCHAGSPMRAFGGQVAAQALIAAGTTVDEPGRKVHSTHSYFLRPGSTTDHIVYLVDRPRDGRTFSTRRVRAVQYGVTIFTMSASFAGPDTGPEHGMISGGRDSTYWIQFVPPPETVAPTEVLEHIGTRIDEGSPNRAGQLADNGFPSNKMLDLRVVDRKEVQGLPEGRWDQLSWVRVRDALPEDNLAQACALTYLSDLTLVGTVLSHHGGRSAADDRDLASIDHAMWFHRPFRADQWVLFVTDSPFAGGGHGLARGEFFDQQGRLFASAVQEALIRDHK